MKNHSFPHGMIRKIYRNRVVTPVYLSLNCPRLVVANSFLFLGDRNETPSRNPLHAFNCRKTVPVFLLPLIVRAYMYCHMIYFGTNVSLSILIYSVWVSRWGHLVLVAFITYIYFSNKRSFRGPGGLGRGLDLRNQPKSVRENWPLWPPGGSRGLPSTTGRTIDIVPKTQIRH